ncbi:hypothetical protein OS493_010889 [Desmophyllum pertusum]|uniref:Uncharacterized protein n=1 Tax=Desmophyllum pertusum TaxID=174260 RepID=A0A9W9ZED1_9CNID|nr:hypothetical protein OS493_010889 [Desmophyllum pertusum]
MFRFPLRTEQMARESKISSSPVSLERLDTIMQELKKIGFEKSLKRSIVDAFKDHQLGMLPRGGVACLLEKKNPKDPVQRPKKAYCFLPLPFETNLPVHINGHFALDHEARRNLWIDEVGHGGYRSDWNSALLSDVVASCYLTMLVEVRTFS